MLAIKPITEYFGIKSPFVKTGKIGLDFALEKVNFVQLGELQKSSIALKSFCSLPYLSTREELLSSPKLLRTLIRSAFSSTHFNGKKIVTSIPSNEVRIISINYQQKSGGSAESGILDSLKDRLDEDLTGYVIDYLPVRGKEMDQEKLAIVALVKKEAVTNYLEVLRYAGLEVDSLEIRPAAINRYIYSNLRKDNYQDILSINFGEVNSYLTVTSGRRLLLDQQIEFGSKKLIESISNTLDISINSVLDLVSQYGFEDQSQNLESNSIAIENHSKILKEICKPELDKLIDEVNQVLLFFASENHGRSINKIFLLGCMSYWKNLDNYLNSSLKINTESIINPLDKLEDPYQVLTNSNHINGPELSIAIGHALRGLV